LYIRDQDPSQKMA